MIPVSRQKLDKLVTKMRHYDIHPIYLPDINYLYGESHPLNAQLNDLVSELQEYLLIANDDELRATYDVLDSYWREQIQLASLLKRDAQTIKLVATNLIVSLTHQSYYDVKRVYQS